MKIGRYRMHIDPRPHDRIGWVFAFLAPVALLGGAAIGIYIRLNGG